MALSPAIPATRIGNYEILSTLGSGGMGVVYKALDLKLQRVVALKFLSTDPADQERLLREARAASLLDHQNIVAIHSIEQTNDDAWFIVMAYYDGETLEKALAGGPLPPLQAAAIAAQVARGLAHAHERGLVHRDIKPANIILTAEGIAKIVDFGLARHFDMSGSTQSGTFSGTLIYMSPEQLQGHALDARTDIWSLGIVFYRMLTGRLPFAGRSAAEQIWGAVHTMPAAMTGIPEALQLIALRALAKLPDQRYPNCQAMLDDFAQLQVERRRAESSSRRRSTADLQRAVERAGAARPRWRISRRLLIYVFLVLLAALVASRLPLLSPPAPSIQAVARTAAEASRKRLATGMFQMASGYESARPAHALEIYRYAADLNPSDWTGYHQLAFFFWRHRDYEGAIGEWRHVARLNPQNASTHSNLGLSLLALKRLDEASFEFRLALAMEREEPSKYFIYSNLGLLYYQQKQWAEAADVYTKALKLDGSDYRVWGNLALAWEWLNQKPSALEATRQELARLEPLAAKSPGDAALESKLGLVYSQLNRRERALSFTDRALARSPNDRDVLSNAAETYENLGDRPRALQFIRRAIDRGESLDQLDHNPGFRRLLVDPGFRAILAQHTRNLAAPHRE